MDTFSDTTPKTEVLNQTILIKINGVWTAKEFYEFFDLIIKTEEFANSLGGVLKIDVAGYPLGVGNKSQLGVKRLHYSSPGWFEFACESPWILYLLWLVLKRYIPNEKEWSEIEKIELENKIRTKDIEKKDEHDKLDLRKKELELRRMQAETEFIEYLLGRRQRIEDLNTDFFATCLKKLMNDKDILPHNVDKLELLFKSMNEFLLSNKEANIEEIVKNFKIPPDIKLKIKGLDIS